MKSKLIRLSSVAIAVAFVFVFACPTFATWEDTDITIIDYLDYVDREHLVVDGNSKYVVIDIPADYARSIFEQYDSFTFGYGENDKVYIDDNLANYGCFPTISSDRTRTNSGYLFDVSNLPNGACIYFNWKVTLSGNYGWVGSEEVPRYTCYFYGEPDEHNWSYCSGRSHQSALVLNEFNGGKLDCSAVYEHGYGTVGTATNYIAPYLWYPDVTFTYLPAEITVVTSSVRVEFPITDDLISLAQSDKTNKLLNEVNRQLAEQGKTMQDILNGTPEQNEIAGNISGALTDKGDQLGDLVDDIQTEKPNTDSVDVDSIIPQTGITFLSGAITPIAENPLVIKILVMVGTLLLVSYVLFGKRG